PVASVRLYPSSELGSGHRQHAVFDASCFEVILKRFHGRGNMIEQRRMRTHGGVKIFHLLGMGVKTTQTYQEYFGLAATMDQVGDDLQLSRQAVVPETS